MKANVLLMMFLGLFCTATANAKKPTTDYIEWAKKLADSEIKRRPASADEWNYQTALLNNAYLKLFEASEDSAYYHHAKASADYLIDENGLIATYISDEYDLRNLYGGTFLYDVYQHNRGGSKYLNAMILLRRQFYTQPRTQERVFCFTQPQKNEIQIEGLFMAMPFYCMYASMFDEPKVFGDIMLQFSVTDRHTINEATGLNYQAWTEQKGSTWANNKGTTTALFAQSIGFYMMAIVDVLDYFPLDHPYRTNLVETLNRLSKALLKYQDKKTGLWYQVVDQPKASGNYCESSASAMFAYALAKGVNKGYLPENQIKTAQKAFKGLLENCIEQNGDRLTMTRATAEADLQKGNGTNGFYINLPQTDNSPTAIASFILTAVELAKAPHP